ncbi:MAG: T9SS type A sorting domain-containing protein, partial [Melioribacteraceae bacterium]|nr:T9SS type A sorting domain-containing protein [Melioribacteraceae bacterium]
SLLSDYYMLLLNESDDLLLTKNLEQLIILCNVAEEEYQAAISEFTTVADNNEGTEVGLFAEVDALTTSLISDASGMNKISSGKYAVKNANDFTYKISHLLKTGFLPEAQATNEMNVPKEFVLYQNYPNPFNPSTTIKYQIPRRTNVEIKVFDILGKEIVVLVDEIKEAGRYQINFAASKLSSGVYFYQLQSGINIITKKMLLLR